MDYEAVGNSCISSGMSLLALGAFLTSLGWFLLGTYKQANEWMVKWRWFKAIIIRQIIIFILAVALLISGLRMIGKGGVSTTKGWNLLDNHEQKKTLIMAAIRELATNGLRINSKLYTAEDDETLGCIRLYPRFKATRIGAVLASDLFDTAVKRDMDLLGAAVDYELVVEDINARLAASDRFVISTEDAHSIAEHRRKVRDSEAFMSFREKHDRMSELLSSYWKTLSDNPSRVETSSAEGPNTS